ncbi:hypothetical protein, partial [Pseudomonas aeruginosa]|uniref:hypothetical protein n=1 Tax=Pseudomonas aeruginosa TaxID=287 RepID=UPI003CC5F028
PFSLVGPSIWSASLRSWDLFIEMDEQHRVIRVGGRQAYRLHCAHGLGEQPRPIAQDLDPRAPRAPPPGPQPPRQRLL